METFNKIIKVVAVMAIAILIFEMGLAIGKGRIQVQYEYTYYAESDGTKLIRDIEHTVPDALSYDAELKNRGWVCKGIVLK